MKRAQALAAMTFAGYHGDAATWTRLYIENRIAVAVAREAYRNGVKQREAETPCGCPECAATKKEKRSA